MSHKWSETNFSVVFLPHKAYCVSIRFIISTIRIVAVHWNALNDNLAFSINYEHNVWLQKRGEVISLQRGFALQHCWQMRNSPSVQYGVSPGSGLGRALCALSWIFGDIVLTFNREAQLSEHIWGGVGCSARPPGTCCWLNLFCSGLLRI